MYIDRWSNKGYNDTRLKFTLLMNRKNRCNTMYKSMTASDASPINNQKILIQIKYNKKFHCLQKKYFKSFE